MITRCRNSGAGLLGASRPVAERLTIDAHDRPGNGDFADTVGIELVLHVTLLRLERLAGVSGIEPAASGTGAKPDCPT
jgi:hypothetical protein